MLRGSKLGEGTFGIVYEASSPTSGMKYAVKRNLVEDETSFIGVPREVDMLSKLRHHPHIVRLERVAFDEPFSNGVFSPLAGDDRVSQRNDSMHFVFGKAEYDLHTFVYGAIITNFSLIKRYMVHVLLGVEYTHSQNIIHRDLKPSNVLVCGNAKDALGVGNVAKICDFGLAKPFTYQGRQTPNTVTSWYRAPEITLGFPHYDFKADMWSVGCILFEMVAKKSFISVGPDNNDEIVSSILGTLPEQLPMRKLRELVRSNKWRTVILTKAHSPRIRKSFAQQIGFTQSGHQQFESEAGSVDSFCDLLRSLLKFEWEERFTATQALNHPFFADYATVIHATRQKYPTVLPLPSKIYIHECMERKWMAQTVTDIFNNRRALAWYSNRAIFQAMDLFDRYLSAMFRSSKIPANAVESEHKGLIHDKFGAQLRFMTCLYLCVKYFSSIHIPVSFESIVSKEYHTKQALLAAEEFEGGFIQHCLQYNIYRPTIYEAPDEFGDILTDSDVRDLIVFYSMNNSISGMSPRDLYNHYRSNLKGKPIPALLVPICPQTLKQMSHKPIINTQPTSVNNNTFYSQ